MKTILAIQTAMLFLLLTATIVLVIQNQMLLRRLDMAGHSSPAAVRVASNPSMEILDVRIVDVDDEIPVNIQKINDFQIVGMRLPVNSD